MRSPQEINARLAKEPANKLLRLFAGDADVNQLALLISDAYEKAFLNALRHRPNGELVYNFETLTWIAGSDLNVADVPWLQFGMPRIRRMAKELNLPFVPMGSAQTQLHAARMSNGQPCTTRCLRCFHGSKR